MNKTKNPEKINFYGLNVSRFGRNEISNYIDKVIETSDSRIIYGHSLWTIPTMNSHPEIICYGNKSDVLLTDGRWFYYLLILYGYKIPLNLSIPEMTLFLLNKADQKNYSLTLWGATKDINQKAKLNIQMKYPGISRIEGFDGYFNDEIEIEIFEKIKKFRPDILFIGMSSPKKEILASKARDNKCAKVIVPCGGMIDIFAGKTRMTPIILMLCGMASFYRIIQEPKRILRRNIKVYFFVLFKFLPIFLWNTKVIKRKNYSIPREYGIMD